jgi:serine/threonine protein kinase
MVKIIDLGLAKSVIEPGSQTAISMAGGFAGTPEFASPEQFGGVGVDIRSDLYALGVTLWQMVTSHPVFRGSPLEVMYQHQHTPLPIERLEGLPQPLVVLLETLLEKDPARRFQDPVEVLNAIPAVTNAIERRHKVGRRSLRKSGSLDLASPPEFCILAARRQGLARMGSERSRQCHGRDFLD